MATPLLYAHPFSSYCQKVLIAFYELGEPFELQLLEPHNPAAGEALKAVWPVERFPVVQADGRTLLESSVIIEWLDRKHGRLIPADPDLALETRMLDRVFDSYVMTPMQTIVFNRLRPEDAKDPFGDARARDLLDRIYPWLDARLTEGPCAMGEAFTLADCAAAPALFYADWVHPFDAFPNLRAYYRRLRERPSFARAVDEARPYRPYFPGGAPTDRD
jgi:glutathione S-transferase